MYAAQTPEKMIPILFESMPFPWSGPVSMVLGMHLYHDMSKDTSDRNVDELVKIIQKKNGKTLWKYALTNTKDNRLQERAVRMTVKERIAKIVDLYGSVNGDHTGEMVENLFRSIVGEEERGTLPFMEKLKRVETQLGL